jgi:hemerythrin
VGVNKTTNEYFFHWQDEYSVGIQKIDRQHKEIIILIKDLSWLCVVDDKDSYETFKIMLSSAVEYIKNHFWEEEKHMLEKNYPSYLKHKKGHEKMLEELNEMNENLGKEDTVTINGIIEYLVVWYKEHLLGFDKEMGEYFKKLKKIN